MKKAAVFLASVFATPIYCDVSSVTTPVRCEEQQDNHNLTVWFTLANQCDQITTKECPPLTIDDFLATDDQGRSIYDIALQKHKETGSVPCALKAVFLQRKAEDLHRKLLAEEAEVSWQVATLLKQQGELLERRTMFEEVIQKFENPHK